MVYNEIRRKRISRIPLNPPLETQERTLSSYDNKKNSNSNPGNPGFWCRNSGSPLAPTHSLKCPRLRLWEKHSGKGPPKFSYYSR